MVMLNAEGPVWTEKEFANHYNLALPTVRGWRVSGKGPKFLKLGRVVRYRQADVLEWEAAMLRSSTIVKEELADVN